MKLKVICFFIPGIMIQYLGSIGQPIPDFRQYVCHTASEDLKIDGFLDETDWLNTPWTDNFVDIEGNSKPSPTHRTRVKMLWDNQYLYIGAELEEPHLWATLKQRDTIIFYDNDFEVFIDPDGDTHQYYEIEINALGTLWDLMLIKPYRDGGPAISAWDVRGIKTGIQLQGTLNDPSDIDQKWTVEMALPMSILRQNIPGKKLPEDGEQWRINFSRVQWDLVVEAGNYHKKINPENGKPFPEHNWVWSPQGAINMHMPEMWGYVQFSQQPVGSADLATVDFIEKPQEKIKWELRKLYYQLRALREEQGIFQRIDVPEAATLELTTPQYLISWPVQDGIWLINHEGKVWRTQMSDH